MHLFKRIDLVACVVCTRLPETAPCTQRMYTEVVACKKGKEDAILG